MCNIEISTYNCTAWNFWRNSIFLCCPIGSRCLFPPLPCVDFGWILCIHIIKLVIESEKKIFSHWGGKKSVTSISEMLLTQIYLAKDQFHSTHFTKMSQSHQAKTKLHNKKALIETLKCLSVEQWSQLITWRWKLLPLTNEAWILTTDFISRLHTEDWNNVAKKVSYTDFIPLPLISSLGHLEVWPMKEM